MRVTLGSIAALAFAAIACAGCSQEGSAAQVAAAPTGTPVTAVGCPAQPSPACLTIKAKGKVYDITGAVDASRGVAVSVSGTAGGESTACGLKLDGVTVEYNGIRCAAPAPA